MVAVAEGVRPDRIRGDEELNKYNTGVLKLVYFWVFQITRYFLVLWKRIEITSSEMRPTEIS